MEHGGLSRKTFQSSAGLPASYELGTLPEGCCTSTGHNVLQFPSPACKSTGFCLSSCSRKLTAAGGSNKALPSSQVSWRIWLCLSVNVDLLFTGYTSGLPCSWVGCRLVRIEKGQSTRGSTERRRGHPNSCLPGAGTQGAQNLKLPGKVSRGTGTGYRV